MVISYSTTKSMLLLARTHEGFDPAEQLVFPLELRLAHFHRLLAFLLLLVSAECQHSVHHGGDLLLQSVEGFGKGLVGLANSRHNFHVVMSF